VHGYDLKGDVAPGRPAIIEFTANVPGVFEVELEEAGLKLVELQVS
jgi:heme/copper-type cytochrome/quinol oxidase subunit 2